MGQEGGGAADALRRKVGGEGLTYGGGADVPLQPGGDTGGEMGRVAGGEEEAGVVAAQAREKVGGRLEKSRGGVPGARDGGERLARSALLRLGGGSRARGAVGG
ncbi:hypothetical protein QFZ56_005028 [Streptomyces achromogenes]|uniref:Uncharacterized protein n=1 Tax=Streptomyces achromogenes TaxID=67255 RepID=A0ABU0Q5W7_STRAH|nr:hypothetical protein [Streptomyces achromogenes]